MSKVDRQLMRECNIRSVIRLIRDQPGLSQTGLSEQTGLSQATVTSIVRELKARQIVEATGTLDTQGAGRKPVGLRFAGGKQVVAACELHPDELRLALYDLRQNMVGRVDLATDGQLDPSAVVGRITEAVEQLLARRPAGCRDLAGIGLATHGIVDDSCGLVRLAEPMQWSDVPLADLVGSRLTAPVVVEPIGRASAYGEYRLGAGRDVAEMVIVQVNRYAGDRATGPMARRPRNGWRTGPHLHHRPQWQTGNTGRLRLRPSLAGSDGQSRRCARCPLASAKHIPTRCRC
jgi:hypothetical protein